MAASSPSPLLSGRDSRPESKVESWLDAAKWPIPAWYAYSADRTPGFEAFFTQQLRTRYLELEGDFRSVVGNFPPDDSSTAQTIFSFLQVARPALEAKAPDLLTVSSTLDLIERYMVWLYPRHIISTRITSTLLKLDTLQPHGWKRYAADLDRVFEDVTYARAPLDEAIAACNRVLLAQQIGSGLQIKRLRAFRGWGLLMLALFFASMPLLANPMALTGWPVERLLGAGFGFNPWLNALGVLVIGMMGGFLSGLLQSRSSKVSLADYQETMLKLVLRPMVGGIIALILVVLMSWNLIPAIDVQNAGAFFLAAFLSGFSERYFLKLLDLQEDEAAAATPLQPATAAAAPRTSVL
jgi:hypothetical protein